MNYFDIFVLITFMVSAFGGYKTGLIQSLFKTIGYIAGGVASLSLSVTYLTKVDSQIQKIGITLVAILLGASIGQYLFGKLALIFKKVLFVPPFKFLDSTFGAVLFILRTAFILYFVGALLIFSTWSVADKYVSPSKFYTFTDSNLPSTLSDLKIELNKLLEVIP